jgi:hypothetical protein
VALIALIGDFELNSGQALFSTGTDTTPQPFCRKKCKRRSNSAALGG